MSGIVGIINPDGSAVSPSLLDRLTDSLGYLGSDTRTTWLKDNIGFGHTLFKTTRGSEHDHQPLTLDQRTYIVADARIDGREALLDELKASGRSVHKDCSDAELILHAYGVWSEDCVHHLIGDYAFALWDDAQKRLFCARDHFGIKPFYYARVQGALVFSNDLETIRCYPGVSSEFNEQAILDYLVFSINKDQATTFYKDIRRIPPGHSLTYRHDISLTEFWSPAYDTGNIQYADPLEYVEHFSDIFHRAVSDRIRSDDVVIQMSGGTDSTAIAAVAAHLRDQSLTEQKISSLTVASGSLYPQDEEGELASLAAKSLGIDNQQIITDGYGVYSDWENAYKSFPQPVDAPTPALNLDYGKALRQKARVSLTGVGGDPLMYGSGSLALDLIESQGLFRGGLQLLRKLIASGSLKGMGARRLIGRLLGRPIYYVPPIPRWLDKGLVEQHDLRGRWKTLSEKRATCMRHPTACNALVDSVWTHYFENFYCPSVQQTETRHPFFDVRLVDYIFSIPTYPVLDNKDILRQAMTGLLPDKIRLRPKTVFQGSTFRDKIPSTGWVDEIRGFHEPILSPYIDTTAYFSALEQYVQTGKHPAGLITAPLSLSYWLATRD